MDSLEFENIYTNESKHFYYVNTHRLILDLVKRYASHKKSLKILDAGCGTGLLGIKLQSLGSVIGVDINPIAILYAKQRGLSVRMASLEKLPFASKTFDVITSVDVLYHVQVSSDSKALSELFRVLKPGGLLVIRVPAVSWLKRNHDKYVFTRKRYNKPDLCQLLVDAKFAVIFMSYVHGLLFLFAIGIFVLEKIFQSKKPFSNVSPLPRFLNSAVIHILDAEQLIFRPNYLPIGLGLVAVAKKRVDRAIKK